MNTFERQLRRANNSWRTLLGAPIVTVIIFLAIASGAVVVDRPERTEPPQLTFSYVPPKPVPKKKTTPPLSSSYEESFKFDPTLATPKPDIPLDLLPITLDPHIDPSLSIAMDLGRPFDVAKPDIKTGFNIFDHSEVDEIPVWLFGPMPKIPRSIRFQLGETVVLYIVNSRGKTENIYALDATDERLIPGVIKAIDGWSFRPARKNGKAVSVWVQQVISYNPNSGSPFSI